MFSHPIHLLAFGFGAGLAPRAPGTAGTLLGLPLWWALSSLDGLGYGATLLLLTGLGVWICGHSAKVLGLHDAPGIVFDEICGFLLAAAPLLPSLNLWRWPVWAGLGAAFVLFRLFDIWKPWPIRLLDADLHGGLGIMLDDLVAGLYAAALLCFLHYLPV